jgi:hypothetical protein
LAAASLTDKTVTLNGTPLRLDANDAIPAMEGSATAGGELEFEPATITFLSVPSARNQACL